jgi:hypothetical protein
MDRRVGYGRYQECQMEEVLQSDADYEEQT